MHRWACVSGHVFLFVACLLTVGNPVFFVICRNNQTNPPSTLPPPPPLKLAKWGCGASPVLLLLLLSVTSVGAHPGGIAYGRATCGSEYSTPNSPYVIPDIKEAWFLRRIATCSQPSFWTSFDVTEKGQPIYIAVITPELERFQDRLSFNAILYGPGLDSSLPGLRDVPQQLPAGIARNGDLGPGAAYVQSPRDLSTCGFVDENEIMKNFAVKHVKRGRGLEELSFENDYKDPMQAGTTSWSWWLYSFNHTTLVAI
jgi:hypothetical protein